MKSVKVLAVAVTPPAYKASGGVAAAIHLTHEIAGLTPAKIILMSDRNEELAQGPLTIAHHTAYNLFGPLRTKVPRTAASMAWRLDMDAILDRERPDIVHIHNPHPPGAFHQISKACRVRGTPYVLSTHGFVEFSDLASGFGRPAWQRPLIRAAVRAPVEKVIEGAAAVCMLSPLERPILLGMGAREEQLRVVSNGVDRFYCERLTPAVRKSLVERFNLPTGRVLALFVGNHTPNKGIDVLLEAMHHVKAPVTAIIAGAIRSAQDHEAQLQRHRVNAISDRVLFTDFISLEELRALYQSVSLFVFPSRADTLPLVVLEAMASALPVISTTVGGIPYQVSEETGALTPPGDVAALAEAIDAFADSAKRMKAAGEAGRRVVEQRFVWKVAASDALRVYEEVLQR